LGLPFLHTGKPHFDSLKERVLSDFSTPQISNAAVADQFITFDPQTQTQTINDHHVNVFMESAFYNWMIAKEHILRYVFFTLLVIAGLLLVFKIFYLKIKIKRSLKTAAFKNGHKFTLLQNSGLPISSFQLSRKYVVWNNEMDDLSNDEQSAVLSHEISHLQQKNTWEKMGLHLLTAIWFFNPAIYFLKKELKNLSEFIADEFAAIRLGDSKRYAALLLKIQSRNFVGLPQQFNEHPVKTRVKQLLCVKDFSNKRLRKTGFGILLFLGLTTCSILPAVNQQVAKYNAYETMYCIHKETGQIVFCGDCFTEGLDCACVK
jgi:hypothetical protein